MSARGQQERSFGRLSKRFLLCQVVQLSLAARCGINIGWGFVFRSTKHKQCAPMCQILNSSTFETYWRWEGIGNVTDRRVTKDSWQLTLIHTSWHLIFSWLFPAAENSKTVTKTLPFFFITFGPRLQDTGMRKCLSGGQKFPPRFAGRLVLHAPETFYNWPGLFVQIIP